MVSSIKKFLFVMAACLTMATEKSAYVLTDRGTYLAVADPKQLALLFDQVDDGHHGSVVQQPTRAPAREHGHECKGGVALIWSDSRQGLDAQGVFSSQSLSGPSWRRQQSEAHLRRRVTLICAGCPEGRAAGPCSVGSRAPSKIASSEGCALLSHSAIARCSKP